VTTRTSPAPRIVKASVPRLRTLTVSSEEWRRELHDLSAAGAKLLALWGSRGEEAPATVWATFFVERTALVLALPLSDPDAPYPGLEEFFPAAARMQRAVADLLGLRSTDSDTRPWLRHAAWPATYRPLIDPLLPQSSTEPAADHYEFVRVEGVGVHEIAVGPVHAGTIEPGHFRFSVVGEKVLRLEERLGYAHKGIERRFTELPLLEGHRLAARVCGDSAVAFSWAYCQALEAIAETEIPAPAAWLRALCLELERICNHLGDLGALGNDAGFAFGLVQFSRLKELLLRAMEVALGERYLLNAVIPGGTRLDLTTFGARELRQCLLDIAREASALESIYNDHSGLRDRFTGAGTVEPRLAAELGLIGLAGRASGQAVDLRCDLPTEPYTQLAPQMVLHQAGDVAARVAVRFGELEESCRLVHQILEGLPAGPHVRKVSIPPAGALGLGLTEGWRGPVLIALEAGDGGTIRRCHPHDPSWHNWPALEHAIIGNIVPDFPLINKSFNLAYSGHDL
jgi:Ni,Fe-hydrogenase III large subunit/Ni,Fe-hydrogenase III component G